MALTLLDAVNEVAKRARIVAGDAGAFTSLTDTARQTEIDVIVQDWNHVIRQLYSVSNLPLPSESAEATLTLVTGQREYSLSDMSATDLLQVRWPFINTTDGREIFEYPGGYEAMRRDQLQPANYTGLPLYAAWNPTNGKLRMDRSPTANENGDQYTVLYDKDLNISAAASTFPFEDEIVRALVPVVSAIYKGDRGKDPSVLSPVQFGQAARLLTRKQPRSRW